MKVFRISIAALVFAAFAILAYTQTRPAANSCGACQQASRCSSEHCDHRLDSFQRRQSGHRASDERDESARSEVSTTAQRIAGNARPSDHDAS